MRWVEIALEADSEAVESVTAVLLPYVYQGVAIESVSPENNFPNSESPSDRSVLIRGYFLDDGQALATRQEAGQALRELRASCPISEPQYSVVDDDQWWEAWRFNMFASRVGSNIYICPSWALRPELPGEVILAIESGVAFGTGAHSTTQMMLEAIEDLRESLPGSRVVDLGCGTGILACAALKMGAGHVLALDIDPNAVRITGENAAVNGVQDRITVQLGSLDSLLPVAQPCDLLLVNILGPVIISMCSKGLADVLRPGGVGLFSGILEVEAEKAESALSAVGLKPYRRRASLGWVVVEARREQPPEPPQSNR